MRLAPLVIFALAGCPPRQTTPVGARPQQQQQQQQQPVYQPPWPTEAPPPASANADVPIDPAAPMPAQSLSTNATLELGKPTSVVIDGRADIFSSGLAAPDASRGGKLPAQITLVTNGGYLTFSRVRGKIGCGAGESAGPDGGTCAGGDTDILAANGISGIVDHQRTQFVVGVFLGTSTSVRAPARLDFSKEATGESFAELTPLLGQTFFIGDGMTPSGLNQRFVVPPNATRFYIGFADAIGFQGPPGAYADNTGGVSVTLTQAR
ncbi:MAG: hypothetical protein H0T46_02570 [Deltaproteobacteria bacterium]|nr:hypothetical protein [Deltaproteobacteria bacterium]